MNTSMRLVAVLFLLLGCGSSAEPDPVEVDDGAPGPADAFVGVWQGSGSYKSKSDANGELLFTDIEGRVTISRLRSTEVQLDPRDLAGFGCDTVIYDVGTDLHGVLRKDQDCFVADIYLKDEVLTLLGMSSDGALMQPTTYIESVTLKRVP